MIIRETKGYCPCCCQETVFISEDYWLRDYYRCHKCGSIPRQRALMKVLRNYYPDLKDIVIHESSPSQEIAMRLKQEARFYSYSYFYEKLPLGTVLENGATNQNLEYLSFPDNSFDVFITQDVMEHIYNPIKAVREIERVLRTGGMHIFTTPIYLFSKTRARVEIRNGTLEYLFPPIYHGNPISNEGSLVTYDWGDDIASVIDSAAYRTKTEVIQFPQTEENYKYGLEADFLQVIISRKC